MQTQTTSRDQLQRAVDKASALRWWSRVEEVGDAYVVESSRAPRYYVVRKGRDGEWACDCPAGGRGLRCYHLASALLAHARDSMLTQQVRETVAAVSAPASVATTLRAAGGGRSALVLDDEEQAARDFYGALATAGT